MKLYSKIGWVILLAFLLSLKGIKLKADLWIQLKVPELTNQSWRTYTWLEARNHEGMVSPSVWLVQQRVYRRLFNGWETGLGVAFVDIESPYDGWNGQTRIDWEINPRWNFGKESSIQLRNRLEWRSYEKAGETSRLISRHRVLYSKRAHWFGKMRRFVISDELFFDARLGVLVENRFRPLNLRFAATDRTNMDVFAQLRSRRLNAAHSWSHTGILGIGLSFR